MSKTFIESNEVNLIASINLPASKSISNRICIINEVLNQIIGKKAHIHNYSNSDDTNIILESISITKGEVDIKNAGTCLRFLTAYYAAIPGTEIILNGSHRMKERPILSLIHALTKLGANITFINNNNQLPVLIKGAKLKGGEIEIDANESSQFTSALMMIAPLMEMPLKLILKGEVVSKDYIGMTQILLNKFGIACTINPDFSLVQIENKIEGPLTEFHIEADWSSAAFFYEAAVFADKADLLFPGLFLDSIQGDVILANWMEKLGIKTIQKPEGIYITKGKNELQTNLEIDFCNHPDLAPAIICATAGSSIIFKALGIGSLLHKESNRIEAIAKGLRQLHYKVNYQTNLLEHDGLQHSFYENSIIDTFDDHRIAMSFAMMSIFQSNIVLSESESVVKSFPNFWQEASKIGIKTRIIGKGK